jgi:hypothetical protein
VHSSELEVLWERNGPQVSSPSPGAGAIDRGTGHLRITENSRLATAAAAMKQRMITRSNVRVLLLLPTLERRSRELADIVAAV